MTTSNSEQAVAYAALILADENTASTPEKLQALLKAAGVEDAEPIWTTLFANALKDKDVKEVLTAVSAAPAGRGESKEDGKEEGKGDEDKDEGTDIGAESDEDMGCFGLFD